MIKRGLRSAHIAIVALATSLCSPISAVAIEPSHPTTYRASGAPVEPISESTVVAEAEEFSVESRGAKNDAGDWRPMPWGENYYCATFGNTFLSRKAFLGAAEQA